VDHLLPVFADERLDRITAESIDRYARSKAAEGELSNGSVNKTLAVLSRVLEQAVEYDHIARNPAAGKRRRLRTTKPPRLFLEPAQVTALLDAASELDNEDHSRRRHRRALLATLAFAGLSVGELLALRWADVNLATGRIRVRESKTTAGVRTIGVQPELRDELLSWKQSTRHGEPEDFVFPTSTGRADNRNNVRRRVLVRAVERANERIGEGGDCEPLPDGLSPHALRRTFSSWLIAEGEDVSYVMDQMGHADSKMTMDVYSKALKSKRRRAQARRTAEGVGSGARRGAEWAGKGTNDARGLPDAVERRAA
jgi:integrase